MLKVYNEQNQKAKTPTRTQPSSGKRDEVVLSPKAQEFGQLLQKLKALPEVRQDKVASLKAKVDAGEYFVSAKDIAGKMLGRE